MEQVDLAVIGAGVTGLTAGKTASNCGLDTVVIERLAAGGQIATVDHISNFPPHPAGVAGYDLGPMLEEQASASGTRFVFDEVGSILPSTGGFLLDGATGQIAARAVIVATGSRRKTLGVAGEAAFAGRGVSQCASCDGPLFGAGPVVVVGGGDSAFDEAEVLARQGCRVILLHRGDTPVANAQTVDRVASLANVQILPQHEVIAVAGGDRVERVEVLGADGGYDIACAGVFVYVGLLPNSDIVRGLTALDDGLRIETDGNYQTQLPGLFAAGDVRSGASGYLVDLAEEGAAAARTVYDYLLEF